MEPGRSVKNYINRVPQKLDHHDQDTAAALEVQRYLCCKLQTEHSFEVDTQNTCHQSIWLNDLKNGLPIRSWVTVLEKVDLWDLKCHPLSSYHLILLDICVELCPTCVWILEIGMKIFKSRCTFFSKFEGTSCRWNITYKNIRRRDKLQTWTKKATVETFVDWNISYLFN